ncbi:hypothetical protein A9993_07675 [Rahnella victoriana]|uniref:hypothetical protein n=1 Tax=Rahnella victoriana TaxID=1510570 RepID=UPI000BB1E833|nr:hypothetical protein [Rahnella victoriana]PBI79623.1 hypothetical protein A9993_07675 [Rahnella victoriana]
MITFKHFLDRPSWAAAAGYDFNVFDCLSYSAQKFGFADVLDLLEDTGDIELRQAFWKLPVNALAMIVLLSWPLIFWVNGIMVYIKCRLTKRNYAGSKRTERVEINLRNWLADFDWRQRRGRG